MGKIGKLKITVPWNKLHSSPVEVIVESVNIVVTPIGRNEWTDNADTLQTNYDLRKKFLDAFTKNLFNDLIVSVKSLRRRILVKRCISFFFFAMCRKPRKLLRMSRGCLSAWRHGRWTTCKCRSKTCMCASSPITRTFPTICFRWVPRLSNSIYRPLTRTGKSNSWIEHSLSSLRSHYTRSW